MSDILDQNVLITTVIGLVGAAIGQELRDCPDMYDYPRVAPNLVAIFLVVLALDRVVTAPLAAPARRASLQPAPPVEAPLGIGVGEPAGCSQGRLCEDRQRNGGSDEP
jgi:hypothetical protein